MIFGIFSLKFGIFQKFGVSRWLSTVQGEKQFSPTNLSRTRCRLQGHELLRTVQRSFRFALLMFDLDGSGADGMDQTQVEASAESQLAASGWKNRSAAIVIAPELEIWVWADSPWVDSVLGWKNRSPALRTWLASEGMAFDKMGKPANPKGAMEQALRFVRKPRSSSLYRELAENVNFKTCLDPAFLKLKACLQKWFPKS